MCEVMKGSKQQASARPDEVMEKSEYGETNSIRARKNVMRAEKSDGPREGDKEKESANERTRQIDDDVVMVAKKEKCA
jgi:hypothetical protein